MNEAAPAFRVPGELERLLVTESGFFLGLGWVGDGGFGPAQWSLEAAPARRPVPAAALRGYGLEAGASRDLGFRIFGKAETGGLIAAALRVRAEYGAAAFEASGAPEVVGEKRLLDAFLEAVAAQAGGEAELTGFLGGPGGADLTALMARHVAACLANPHVESFGRRPVTRALVTALGHSADPMATQPLLFRRAGIAFEQWVYVCASREIGARALETARWVADLYEAMVTVVVLAEDGGAGAACDIGVACAEAEAVALVGRDVYPSRVHAERTRAAWASRALGGDLCGGLLLADDHTLASAGLRFERETHLPGGAGPSARPVAWARAAAIGARSAVPSVAGPPTPVPAVPLAFMTFAKSAFERNGGFGSRYAYEGSEDLDLALRWREAGGRVLVDPELRFLQLDGYNNRSPARRGAKIVNRGLFTLRRPDLGARSAA